MPTTVNAPPTTMPPSPALPAAPLHLTLIVATATRTLGIGRAGQLPWPPLKGEMGYFARVTKRTVGSIPQQSTGSAPTTRNAVIMGRKTWDSIPTKFRPLKGRLNVVVTRGGGGPGAGPTETDLSADGPLVAKSLIAAIDRLSPLVAAGEVGRVFVIGGASIYDAALALSEDKGAVAANILLTNVRRRGGNGDGSQTPTSTTDPSIDEFACDTFFPLDPSRAPGWRRSDQAGLSAFVGEEVAPGFASDSGKDDKAADVEYEFCLYQNTSTAG